MRTALNLWITMSLVLLNRYPINSENAQGEQICNSPKPAQTTHSTCVVSLDGVMRTIGLQETCPFLENSSTRSIPGYVTGYVKGIMTCAL